MDRCSVRIQSLCATGSASVGAAQDAEHWQKPVAHTETVNQVTVYADPCKILFRSGLRMIRSTWPKRESTGVSGEKPVSSPPKLSFRGELGTGPESSRPHPFCEASSGGVFRG